MGPCLPLTLFVVALLAPGASSCYFPVEMQGEFMTQWLDTAAEISYTSLSILYNSIPGWGACHSRQGERVVLRQGETCFRCISLVQRSASVQQLHTREVGQCHPTEELALASCPRPEERAGRLVTEMMLYKTRGFYGEAAAGEAHCPITGRHSVERVAGAGAGCRGEQAAARPQAGCPSEGRLSLGCPAGPRLELQCLGHWRGEDGRQYLSLLDTQLPQLGEEPRPRYRCALYRREGAVTHLALSNDSTCVHQLESEEQGAEVFILRREQKTRRPRSRGQRLPAWAQGQWEDLSVEGAALTYRDSRARRTLHARALASPGGGRYVVSLASECGEQLGFTCLHLEQRTPTVLEFRLEARQTVQSVREASMLCAMEPTGPWRVAARPGRGEACPLPGRYTGVIPDSGAGLCATSATSCSRPDRMAYTVFSCANASQVYEEREYQCLGQFTEGGLTYTLTRRLDLPLQECFVGSSEGETGHRVLEAGAHCARGRDPATDGMVMERLGGRTEHCGGGSQLASRAPVRRHRHPLYQGQGHQGVQVVAVQIDAVEPLPSRSSLHSLTLTVILASCLLRLLSR